MLDASQPFFDVTQRRGVLLELGAFRCWRALLEPAQVGPHAVEHAFADAPLVQEIFFARTERASEQLGMNARRIDPCRYRRATA